MDTSSIFPGESMNFLAHLFLSGDDPELLVGNLIGDFVKGRLVGQFPSGIERGIYLHRRIDSFAGQNRHFLQSKRRIDVSFGHYRGVLIDLFFDHFLAVHWDEYSDVTFNCFLSEALRIVRTYDNVIPEHLRRLMPIIFDELLPSYCEIKGIDRALQRMSNRIKRPNRLGEGADELRKHYDGFYSDFCAFMPVLSFFARDFIGDSLNIPRPEKTKF
jgi:acyl carrier protein phosphodiesterase